MDLNAAEARRAIELTRYTTAQLVGLLRTTDSMADYAMVGGLLCAREEQLKATVADALSKVQAHDDLRRASLGAEEEAGAVVMAAVSKMHEVGTKKQDEVSASLDAALAEIHVVLHRQREELSASMAMIIEETETKLKASFSKIHAPLKKPNHDAVPSQETPHVQALLTLWGTPPSIPVAQQSKQPVVEMVKVNKGTGVCTAADGSAGKSLKRKANTVENRGVSPPPVQISRELQEMMEDIGVPPGYNPIPRFSGELQESMEDIGVPPGFSPSSLIYEKPGPSSYSSPSQAIKVNAKVSKEVAPVEGSGKAVILKEPTPLVETEESNAPSSEATQDEAAEEPAHLGGASMSLITVPVEQVERLDGATVSKRGRGRGRGRAVAKDNKKNKKVSGGNGSLGSGRGRGISDTSSNWVLGARSELACRSWQSHSLNRPSPVLRSAPPVQNCSSNGSQSKNDELFLQSSGHATAGTRELVLVMPRSSPLRINSASGSGAQNRCISGMGCKVTENLGKCVENRADSVPVINDAAEGTSYEEGDLAGGSSNDTGGAFPRA